MSESKPTYGERRRSNDVSDAVRAVKECAKKLNDETNEFKRFQLCWELAFVKLYNLEDHRKAGNTSW